MGVADITSARVYLMSRSYSIGDVIRHETFGPGVVIRKISDFKIEVSFRDGIRLLACNWKKRPVSH